MTGGTGFTGSSGFTGQTGLQNQTMLPMYHFSLAFVKHPHALPYCKRHAKPYLRPASYHSLSLRLTSLPSADTGLTGGTGLTGYTGLTGDTGLSGYCTLLLHNKVPLSSSVCSTGSCGLKCVMRIHKRIPHALQPGYENNRFDSLLYAGLTGGTGVTGSTGLSGLRSAPTLVASLALKLSL